MNKHLFKTEYGFCDILRVEENGQVKWYHIDSDYNLAYPYNGPSPITDELEQEYQQMRIEKRDIKLNKILK